MCFITWKENWFVWVRSDSFVMAVSHLNVFSRFRNRYKFKAKYIFLSNWS